MKTLATLALLLALTGSAFAAGGPPAATLLAAGDVAGCGSPGARETAALLARLPGTIAVLGDSAYDAGTSSELRDCYGPTWGRFRPRTRAALGNHEYGTGTAAAAIAYFHLPRDGWYSYRLGAWHVVVLNANCWAVGGCGAGSPQWRWLERDLSASRAACTLAYWHQPRWSSGLHGSDAQLADLWRLLARHRVDVVLAGHDHDYERFAPIDGIRSFVVGTGGRSHYALPARRLPTSVVGNSDTFGVLRLTLRPAGYDWRFVPIAGGTFTDAGSGVCR